MNISIKTALYALVAYMVLATAFNAGRIYQIQQDMLLLDTKTGLEYLPGNRLPASPAGPLA